MAHKLQQSGVSTLVESTMPFTVYATPTIHNSSKAPTSAASPRTDKALPALPAAPAVTSTFNPKGLSSAAQTKVLVKGALGLLSSAADGIPIPGVKGIFATIIKVIGVIEVSAVQFRAYVYLILLYRPLKSIKKGSKNSEFVVTSYWNL